jgi:membrane-bound lytic murein transglycosylase D
MKRLARPVFAENATWVSPSRARSPVVEQGDATPACVAARGQRLSSCGILVTHPRAGRVVDVRRAARAEPSLLLPSRPITVARSAAAALTLALLTACATVAPAVGDRSAMNVPVATAVPVPSPAASVPAAEAAASAAQGGDMAAVAERAVETPIDPLRPEVPVDLDDRTAQIDLWQRVRNGFGIADLDDEFVRRRERYYAGKPDYVQRMAERGSRYLFHVVEEVQRRNLPSELALLPFIESAFNPQAMSSARASGMWQFMPATGRVFDLKQNVFRDDRRDVLASTRAALDYLTKLHDMFGDWHLALAAYNWGEGNVQRAIARNQRAGRPTDYSSLNMPAETRDYVPKLQAMKNIVANPQAFSLELPALHNHPYFLSVPITRDIDVILAARLAQLPLDEFLALNPQMNKPVILAAGTPRVLLPYDNADTFLKGVEEHRGQMASWTAWITPRSMKTAQAAQSVGMTESDLRSVNNIPPRMVVKAGSTLLVPRSANRQTDVTEQIADNATMALAPDGPALKRVAFRAGKKGDTVAAIARRYRVSAASVAQWNNVTAAAHFPAGSTVVVFVPTHKATGRSGGKRVATSKSAAKRSTKAVKVAAAPAATAKR